jgi:hypothetical protein
MENNGFSCLTSEYINKNTQNFACVPDVTIFCPPLLTDYALFFEFQYCRMQALSTEFESFRTTRGCKYRCIGSSHTCWCTSEMHTLTALSARCRCSLCYSFLNWPVNRSVVITEVDCDVGLTRTDSIDISRDTDEERTTNRKFIDLWFIWQHPLYLTVYNTNVRMIGEWLIEKNLLGNGRRSTYVISLHLSGGNEENPLKLGQDIQCWNIFYYVMLKRPSWPVVWIGLWSLRVQNDGALGIKMVH